MDMRIYFQKLREVEGEIAEPHVVVVSLETGDGGKAGVKTEVTRANAARLILDGRARLANEGETAEFRAELREAYDRALREEQARRMPMMMLPDAELRRRTPK